MDKKTLLAIVLSVVVISVGFMLQNVLSPPEEAPAEIVAPGPGTFGAEGDSQADASQLEDSGTSNGGTATANDVAGSQSLVKPVENDQLRERSTTIETDLFIATLSSRGGEITSLKLREQLEAERHLDKKPRARDLTAPCALIINCARSGLHELEAPRGHHELRSSGEQQTAPA